MREAVTAGCDVIIVVLNVKYFLTSLYLCRVVYILYFTIILSFSIVVVYLFYIHCIFIYLMD